LVYLKRIFARWRQLAIMFEAVIRIHSRGEWEWQLRDEGGNVLSHGLEETRAAAKYKGARALFQALLVRASQRVL